MTREHISTTVDQELLAAVRDRRPGASDSSVLDEALGALLADLGRAGVDRAYREAYQRVPFGEPDAWGDLASFGVAVDCR